MKSMHKDGTSNADIMLFALSTCVWCKKAKAFLDSLGVAYDYIYVDELSGSEREEAITEVKNWNPDCSFPTMVINREICIVGADEEKIREALKG